MEDQAAELRAMMQKSNGGKASDHKTRVIAVTSGKGGVGKTTIVSMLGKSLAHSGYKTMLIDMDFGLNNLDVVMAIENKIVYDLIDVIEGRCRPKKALIQDFYESNLYVFPSTRSFCRVKFGSEILIRIINELEDSFDFILIDCPAGIDGGFRRAVECANEFIVITTPHLSAIRDAGKVIGCINVLNKSNPYLIVNRARGDLIVDGIMIDVDMISNNLNAELIGVMPEDDVISSQMLIENTVEFNSLSKASIDMVARFLIAPKNIKVF